MQLECGKYYHFDNRSNNNELVFKENENYRFFLTRYQQCLGGQVSTIAYCLMPTHFHFIFKILTEDQESIRTDVATLLSRYTKSINRRYDRHGSLFQPRSKAKEIDDESYLLTLISYVHQNPIRASLIKRPEDWPYSSYRELIQIKKPTFVNTELIRHYFPTTQEFQKYSEEIVKEVKKKYWV